MTSERGAAFFDLDRTLLAGASGQVFSAALRSAGVVSEQEVPGERLAFGLFNAIGETLPTMALARQAVTLAKGRSRAAMRSAAESVADELCSMVRPFAETAFTSHRDAGRPVVLATTTPYDLVRPFAERLGLDDVIATKYAVGPDGNYDGTLDGPFVWSAGKLAAITEWADRHGVDLRASYAYSDSVYDTPMLSAVGHPVVVNPDPRMVLVAAARRWPTLDLEVSPGVVKVPVVGLRLQQLALRFAKPAAYPYARFEIDGIEHIPKHGAAILCANHRSYFDPAAMSIAIGRSGRTARFLGKKEIFDAPVVGPLATAMGGIRVDRSSGSDEPLQAAAEALADGDMVTIMPQGTIPRGTAFFEAPKGRYGAARLAAMSGAPVIPVGLWGTDRVWPRSSRMPNVLNLTDPPNVRVRVGPPVELTHRSNAADTERIMAAIVALLPDEAREVRTPTADEIARTYPPGHSDDPGVDGERRPGRD